MESPKQDLGSDWRDSCPTIRDKHLHVLNSGEFSDVVFIVGETRERIQGHKFILTLASPVFEVQFSERWNNKNGIEIPDVTPTAFQMFLKFVYTDEFAVSEDEAEDVLSLAHMYLIKHLVNKCSDLLGLRSHITVSNAVNLHRIASRFGIVEESLQKNAIDFILMNAHSVLQEPGFLKIDHDTLSLILKNDRLGAEEIIIFRAVMKWAEIQCQVDNLDCTIQNKVLALKDLIHLIRFTLMSTEEFTNEVSIGKHEGILSDRELIAVYQYRTAGESVRSLLPALPFNVTNRHGGIYKHDVNEIASRHYNLEKHCRRHGVSSTARCENILRFQSSRNICIKAVELYQAVDIGNPTPYLVFNESGSVSSGVHLSVSLGGENDTTTGVFVTEMNPNIESDENGCRIEKNKNYNMILVIESMGPNPNMDVASPGDGMKLSNPVKVVGPEDLELNFTGGATKCHRPRCGLCISLGQIKSIYFTID